MKRTTRSHETPDAAHAIAAWASSRAPDEVGAIADAIWGLTRSRPDHFPELAEGARAVLATSEGPSGLVLLASLLEQTAQRLRAAAETLADGRTKPTR